MPWSLKFLMRLTICLGRDNAVETSGLSVLVWPGITIEFLLIENDTSMQRKSHGADRH